MSLRQLDFACIGMVSATATPKARMGRRIAPTAHSERINRCRRAYCPPIPPPPAPVGTRIDMPPGP